jgi:hypothetical protein
MNYVARLEKLEAELSPARIARCCVLVNEADTEAGIARWRTANDWPDDGRHPITVLHVKYVKSGSG